MISLSNGAGDLQSYYLLIYYIFLLVCINECIVKSSNSSISRFAFRNKYYICIVGIILSVTFDSHQALDELWRCYEDGSLGETIASALITPQLLRGARVKFINLRTRMYEDEYVSVKEELELTQTKEISLPTKGTLIIYVFIINGHGNNSILSIS